MLALKSAEEAVFVWEDSFTETASWLGFLGWSDRTFSYNGDVFDEDLVQEILNQGSMKNKVVRGSDGVYEAEYVGDFYSDANVAVKLFVPKKNMKGTKVTVQQLEKDIATFDAEIGKINEELGEITRKINGLETTTYSSEDFQRDLIKHKTSKEELTIELASKSSILYSIERDLRESVSVYNSLYQIQSAIDQAIRPGMVSEHVRNLGRLVRAGGGVTSTVAGSGGSFGVATASAVLGK